MDDEAFSDPEFSLVNGELEAGRLRPAFTVLQDLFLIEEASQSLGHDEFSFGAAVVSGEWIKLFPDETVLKGTYFLARLPLGMGWRGGACCEGRPLPWENILLDRFPVFLPGTILRVDS